MVIAVVVVMSVEISTSVVLMPVFVITGDVMSTIHSNVFRILTRPTILTGQLIDEATASIAWAFLQINVVTKTYFVS